MFENNVFEDWLDKKSKELVTKIGNGESLSSEEMIILVLKAQSNHFVHLDIDMKEDMQELRTDLTSDMQELRTDLTSDMKELRTDLTADMKELRTDLTADMKELRIDMDKRFEQVFDRMDRFMFWSLGLTITSTFFILGFMKFGL